MGSATDVRYGISPLTLVLGIAAFLVFVYWQTFVGIADLWQKSSHQHGVLVIPISAYLAWRLKPQLRDIRLETEPLAVLLVLVMVAFWIASRLTGIQLIEQATALLLIPATVAALGGRELIRKLMFPLAFIVLSLPIGDAFVPYLISLTADLSSAMLRLSGVPVLRDGRYFSLPGGEFVVAEVCSGVRYLMAGTIVALLFAYLSYRSMFKRLAFLCTTATVLVLGNGLRAFLVMAIASATNMKYLGGADHIFFGWVLFGVLMVTVMWVGGRFADHPSSHQGDAEPHQIVGGGLRGTTLVAVLGLTMLAATLNPLQSEAASIGKVVFGLVVLLAAVLLARRQGLKAGKSADGGDANRSARYLHLRSSAVVVVIALILASGPQLVGLLERLAPAVAETVSTRNLESCRAGGQWNLGWSPSMQDADAEYSATAVCDGREVNLYSAGYASALQGKELVSQANSVIPAGWDRYTRSSTVEVVGTGGAVWPVIELTVNAPTFEGLVWYWYDIDGKVSTSGAAVKGLQLLALLRRRPAGGHIVVLAVESGEGNESARLTLEQVVRDFSGRGAG